MNTKRYLFLFLFLALVFPAWAEKAGKEQALRAVLEKDSKVGIIVLGTAPLDETTPSLDMIRRVETGIRILKESPDSVLILSGGRAVGNVSEAKMMARMAYAQGIPATRVILEEDSRSTQENARFLARQKFKIIILVTRPTHLARAVSVFQKHPEFSKIAGVASEISETEMLEDLEKYLKFHDSLRVRQQMQKILAEYRSRKD
jgi:uncharacterized SAM-binding protein YcdF (DUF218 family)